MLQRWHIQHWLSHIIFSRAISVVKYFLSFLILVICHLVLLIVKCLKPTLGASVHFSNCSCTLNVSWDNKKIFKFPLFTSKLSQKVTSMFFGNFFSCQAWIILVNKMRSVSFFKYFKFSCSICITNLLQFIQFFSIDLLLRATS